MGEMCDFEAQFFPENWYRAGLRLSKKTPKQRVVSRYPKAYALKYETMACVYMKPAKAVPRGRIADAVVIGTGATVRAAWLDAANRLAESRKRPRTPTQDTTP